MNLKTLISEYSSSKKDKSTCKSLSVNVKCWSQNICFKGNISIVLNLMSVKTDVGRLHIKHLVDPSVDYSGVID